MARCVPVICPFCVALIKQVFSKDRLYFSNFVCLVQLNFSFVFGLNVCVARCKCYVLLLDHSQIHAKPGHRFTSLSVRHSVMHVPSTLGHRID